MLADVLGQTGDGVDDDVAARGPAAADLARHLPQRAHRLGDEVDTEVVHRCVVAVEGRGDDPGLAGDLAKADVGEAAIGDEVERHLEQPLAGALLALGAGLAFRRRPLAAGAARPAGALAHRLSVRPCWISNGIPACGPSRPQELTPP